jgi:hypothetical protein
MRWKQISGVALPENPWTDGNQSADETLAVPNSADCFIRGLIPMNEAVESNI